jgi:hypothetical protein
MAVLSRDVGGTVRIPVGSNSGRASSLTFLRLKHVLGPGLAVGVG